MRIITALGHAQPLRKERQGLQLDPDQALFHSSTERKGWRKPYIVNPVVNKNGYFPLGGSFQIFMPSHLTGSHVFAKANGKLGTNCGKQQDFGVWKLNPRPSLRIWINNWIQHSTKWMDTPTRQAIGKVKGTIFSFLSYLTIGEIHQSQQT